MRVLLLGAGGSAGWNFATAVRDHYDLVGADIDPTMLGLSACPENVVLETPLGPERLTEIQQVIADYDIGFIHAQPDPEVRWLGEYRHMLSAGTFLPSSRVLRLCEDKLATARELGPDLAPVSDLLGPEQFNRLGGSAWMRLRRGAGSMGALPVHDYKMADQWWRHWQRARGLDASAWMLAEILPGRDLSWTGVYSGGRLIASACKERESLMGASRNPANISSTATVQRIVVRPDVNAQCESAVSRIDSDAQGIWMIDLREDDEGVPKVTEINCGRFGTTSLFWARASVGRLGNLPLTYLDVGTSQPERDVCHEGAVWARQPDMGARLLEKAAA